MVFLNDLQSHVVHTRQSELLSFSLWWGPDRDYCHWYWWYKSISRLQSLTKMMNSFLKTVLEKILFCFSLYQHTTRSAIPILSSLEFYARKVFAYCWRKINDLNWKIEWEYLLNTCTQFIELWFITYILFIVSKFCEHSDILYVPLKEWNQVLLDSDCFWWSTIRYSLRQMTTRTVYVCWLMIKVCF